ncbi:MAG: hypothetical protein IJW10_02565 [Clostridia bacterium]|nr:hypothetical protein [Clostridia bacterium]
MKKKLLLLTVLVMAFVMLFAMSVSAAEYFGNVEIIDNDGDGQSDIKVTDKIHSVIYKDNENGVPATEDARVKLSCTCEKGSHTFPAYYICVIDPNVKETLYNLNYSALNALREDYCGSTTDYSITSLVAFEFPNGLKGAYNGLFGKKVATAIKYVSFAKCTTITTVNDAAGGNNWLEAATSLEAVDFGTTLTKILPISAIIVIT